MSPQGWILMLIVGIATAVGPSARRMDEGSLRSALDAVTRKQRYLDANPLDYYSDLRSFKYHGGDGGRFERARDRFQIDDDDDEDDGEADEDLEFLPFENGQQEGIGEDFQRISSNGHWYDKSPKRTSSDKLLERALLDYLENMPDQANEPVPSSFRERERSGSRKRGIDIERPNISDKRPVKKFANEMLNGSPYGLAEMDDVDYLEAKQAVYDSTRDRENKGYSNDLSNSPAFWGDIFDESRASARARNRGRDRDDDPDDRRSQDLFLGSAERRNVNGRYPLGRDYRYRETRKRYPVAKRSPKPLPTKRRVTDPKVAQDLGALFGVEPTVDARNQTQEHRGHDHERTSESPASTTARPSRGQKENATKESKSRERAIEVKKKSVDWSQYFGIDRRRKKATLLARPGTRDQDDEWLLQRYYNTMAENLRPSEFGTSEKDSGDKRDKLAQMDSRLKNMEDRIIEEAVSYSGAEDGANSQQAINDNVIARMAAAYSLEKMRRALNEFKNNVAAQREFQRAAASRDNASSEYSSAAGSSRSEDKRGFVESQEENDGFETKADCPAIELYHNRCMYIQESIVDHPRVFYLPCVMHQICKACAWEDDEDECDDTFAVEAAKACETKNVRNEKCYWSVQVFFRLRPPALCPSCLRRYYLRYRHRNRN